MRLSAKQRRQHAHRPTHPNFGGRFEYLSAIQEHCPEVLRSLRRDAFPVIQAYLQRNPEGAGAASELQTHNHARALETLASLSRNVQRTASPELQAVHQAVRKWADALKIREDWILDAAVQSMHAWGLGGIVGKWVYIVAGLKGPEFQLRFGSWMPYFMRWPEFKRHADAVYGRELKKYHAEVSKRWGHGQPKLSDHAVWTVLWQNGNGKSPQAIQNSHWKTTGRKTSLANIQMRVRDFAASIGLTLRPAKAGPRAKI
jgi:hypothetical protein